MDELLATFEPENDETFEVAESEVTDDGISKMSGEESVTRLVISDCERDTESADFTKVDQSFESHTDMKRDSVTVEADLEERVAVQHVRSDTVPKEGTQGNIESTSSYTAPVDQEMTKGQKAGDLTNGAQERQDKEAVNVEEDHFTRVADSKQSSSGDVADDSSDSTEEGRLSSELETFLRDTPKSISSNDSPRNHQTRSLDPSSTEVQVSSSASDRDRQSDTNSEDPTPRSRKPVFERQFSEDRSAEPVSDTVGANFDAFSEFHQNHVFDIVEVRV